MLKNTVTGFALVALASPCCSARDYEFRFWPSGGSRSDPRVVAIDEGPCGPVATALVSRMPERSPKEGLAPELVYELGERGKVVRRWRIPVDSQVVGVIGARVFFKFNSTYFSVGTDGSIAKAKEGVFPSAVRESLCRTERYFGESAYAACWTHRDAATGKSRLLVYEGACT